MEVGGSRWKGVPHSPTLERDLQLHGGEELLPALLLPTFVNANDPLFETFPVRWVHARRKFPIIFSKENISVGIFGGSHFPLSWHVLAIHESFMEPEGSLLK